MRHFSRLFAALDASTATRDKQAALIRYFTEIAERSARWRLLCDSADDQRAGGAHENFEGDPERDAAWAVYFLAGGKPRQTVPTRVLREAARTIASLPEWLFDESYQAVGDLAETIACILPPPSRHSALGLAAWIEGRLLPLKGESPEAIAAQLADWWDELDTAERFLLTKLIGGGFRVGVSKLSVTRALATLSGVDPKIVAHRLMGYTDTRARPSAASYRALIAPPRLHDASEADADPSSSRSHELRGQPYPFFLAHALNEPVERFNALLGSPADWLVEWKYDGIRGQLVVRSGEAFLWSRGEDLVTDRFPELAALAATIPDGTVIDGEILVWRAPGHAIDGAADRTRIDATLHDAPAPFAELQTRIGRKTLSKKILAEKPVVLVAYDLLEEDGIDLRGEPQSARRARLEALVTAVNASEVARDPASDTAPVLRLSPLLDTGSWSAFATLRGEARARGVEGFMLKHRDARYGVGRTKDVGTWWKWKIDPLSVDAVLIYAQRGHGRRASLYTDFTFAVWDREADGQTDRPRTLVPFAKAYSGLTDQEMTQVDAIVKKTTIEKFGPVRSVKPTQVFELGFEGIQRSTRHKSGIAVRFPRMLRWRIDKPVEEADTIASLQTLLGR